MPWRQIAPELLAVLPAVTLPLLLGVSIVDLRKRRIPNRALLVGFAGTGSAILLAAPGEMFWHLGWMLVAAPPFIALAWARPGGFGMGDAKLIALIAFALGPLTPEALVMAFGIGAAAGAILLSIRGLDARKSSIPFAPFLTIGVSFSLAF